MKKLLLLGGSRYIIPVIRKAHDLGIYVITCDYLPENIGHQFADEYHNVSIVDKEAVLELAMRLQIDGILSFATDPGVVTASYVAEKMGLPGQPYESVKILQHKGHFREFLLNNDFNVPWFRFYKDIKEVLKDSKDFDFPVIVKPVDSAGSKGVSRVEHVDQLENAFNIAMEKSLSHEVILEEFIKPQRCPSDTDCFSLDDELIFASFNNQYFDVAAPNPYTPAGFVWPSKMLIEHQKELRSELQRLIKLLHLGTSIYNVETRIGQDGTPYIMEMSPRGGGNRLAEMLKLSCGVDLIESNVKAAVGMGTEQLLDPIYNGVLGEYILHANHAGRFEGVDIGTNFSNNHVVECDLWVQKGEILHPFSGANETIGTVVLKFETIESAEYAISHPNDWLKIKIT